MRVALLAYHKFKKNACFEAAPLRGSLVVNFDPCTGKIHKNMSRSVLVTLMPDFGIRKTVFFKRTRKQSKCKRFQRMNTTTDDGLPNECSEVCWFEIGTNDINNRRHPDAYITTLA